MPYPSDAFLSGLRRGVRAASPTLALTPEVQRSLLDLFLLEKAAYEIDYEAANRPTWLSVPLRGLVNVVRRLLPEHTAP